MPRRKKQITPDEEEPLARLPNPQELMGTALFSPTDERRQRELEEVLEDIGQDGRVKIWHIIDGKSSYGGEMSMDGFSLESVLDNYGGGDKSLVFYQGKKRVETLRVSLDPSVPPTSPREKKLTDSAPRGGGGMADMSTFLLAMAQSQMNSVDMFSKMMLMMQQGNTSMLQAMTTMLTARPEKDPTETALRIAEVLKPQPGAQGSEMLATFREGMKMAMDLGGNGDEGDGTTALIGKGLEVVSSAISAARPLQQLSPGAPASNGHPGTPVALSSPIAQVPSTTPTPIPTDDDPMAPRSTDRLWVRETRPMLPILAAALPLMSGDSAAVELLRRASNQVIDDLMADLNDTTPPGFIGRVQAIFPGFKPTPQWSQDFIDALRDGVKEDESDEAGEPQELSSMRHVP